MRRNVGPQNFASSVCSFRGYLLKISCCRPDWLPRTARLFYARVTFFCVVSDVSMWLLVLQYRLLCFHTVWTVLRRIFINGRGRSHIYDCSLLLAWQETRHPKTSIVLYFFTCTHINMRRAASNVLVVQCRGLLWISSPSVAIDKKSCKIGD